MAIAAALRELFHGETQAAVAQRLTDGGMNAVSQTTVSAWRRNRVPSLDQMRQIEGIYEKPLGWILQRAGFVDAAALLDVEAIDGGDGDAKRSDGPRPVPYPDFLEYVAELRALTNRVSQLEAALRRRRPRASGG